MKNDRTAQIRQILFRDGKVSCSELVKMFDVTPATIRRDLSELEKEGQIRRTHGGAELLRRKEQEAREISVVPPWPARTYSCRKEKEAIARRISSLIPDNSTIFIDNGTTVFEVVKQITGHNNLTVISNSLRASEYLGMYPNIQVYFLGGKIAHSMLASSGIMASDCLSYFTSIDYCIVSADAFSIENGLREHFMETAILKKAIIDKSSVVIAALDHSKFGKTASAPICNCNVQDIDILVTDSAVPENILSSLREKRINVVVAGG
ncbi:MAG: DeoR/GlpR transcriptional regulator [Spirochaetales bacterium]|nr:DeoR/GlpR transcriptional regulator [Spirochaetales bacterium]